MRRRAAWPLLALAAVLAGVPAAAQIAPEPPGPYVVDVRGATSGRPDGTRGSGLDLGAHVYAGQLGAARLGVGASLLAVTGFRTIAPQVSFNFGTAAGWSYLSAGVGTTLETGRRMTVNAGGGARWFLARHVAIGFDARLHRVAAADTRTASTLFAASAGISVR